MVPEPLHAANQRLADFLGVLVEVKPGLVVSGRKNVTDKVHSPDGSLTISEMDRRAAVARDAQVIVTRCGIAGCKWSHTGPAGEAREKAAAHRRAAHPDLKAKRRGPVHRPRRPDAEKIRPAEAGAVSGEAPPRAGEAAAGLGEGSAKPVGGAKKQGTPRRRFDRDSVRDAFQAFHSEHGRWPLETEWRQARMSPSHETVRALFDRSWRGAVAYAAGVAVAPPEPPRRAKAPQVAPRPASSEKPAQGLPAALAALPPPVLVVAGLVMEAVGHAAALNPADRRLAKAVVRDLLEALLA